MTINVDLLMALRQAMRLCQDVQTHVQNGIDKYSEAKGATEPVTLADYGAQAILCRALANAYPEDGVVSEEGGAQFLQVTTPEQRRDIVERISRFTLSNVSEADVVSWLDFGKHKRNAARTWVIDPIDGTKGFISGRHYAVCVGVLEAGKPKDGMMACPQYRNGRGMMLYTYEGGLYQTNAEGENSQRVGVSQRQDPQTWRALQSYEDSQRNDKDAQKVLEEAGLFPPVRVTDLDSMEKYALIANGDFDLFVRLPKKSHYRHMIWDHVAGVALVLAGGGVVTDWDGGELDFSQGDTLPNQGMIASSGIMHDQLINAALAVQYPPRIV